MQPRLAQPCLLCGARSHAGPLCPGCVGDLPRLPAQRCPVCAQPTPGGAVCGACLKRPPAFDRTEAVFRYAYPLDVLVRRLKYGHQTVLADWLAGQMAPAARPDLILAMPLHPARLRERGYNQAALLAGHLARRLELPCDPKACATPRPRWTCPSRPGAGTSAAPSPAISTWPAGGWLWWTTS